MFSNILLGAAGFPVADLGDTVSQSLRFIGGSQTMQRTFSSTFNASGTLSAWIKVGSSDDAYFFGGNVSGHYEIIGQASQQFYGADRFGSNTYANGKQRDYSGWYHICINFNSGNWWINGQQQSNNLALSNHSNMNNWNVGYSIQGSRPFDGYMAAVIFVDGSDIAETNFGKYNDDGVWVPQDYTGTYGTNGFHLDFADSSDLGNDVSGNNNDFTASGFDTGDIALYSPDFTVSGGFETNNPSSKAFDGSTSTAAVSTNFSSGLVATFAPSQEVSFTQLEVWSSANNATGTTYAWNGNSVSGQKNAWMQLTNQSGTLNSSTPITITSGGNASCTLSAVRINGTTILVDNFDNDVDYLDTPTSNYATFNPIVNPGFGTNHDSGVTPPSIDQANLRATGAQNNYPGVTMSTLTNDKVYFEWTSSGDDDYRPGLTLCNINYTTNSRSSSSLIEVFRNGYVSIFNGTDLNAGTFPSWSADDVVRVTYDNTTHQLSIAVNGGSFTTVDLDNITGGYVIPDNYSFGLSLNDVGHYGYINYGQRPFIYTIPTGFSALQTNNLPEPTIKNGRDHFDVALYTGNSSTPPTVTGLNFQPDFIWIKIYSSGSNHSLYDSIRGATKVICSSSDSDEETDGEITPTSDGFTVGADNTIIGSTNSNGHNYVAWCWKAGGTAVSNTDGTITSSVSANTDAGFSIISYTGNETTSQSVGHGLTQAPEFVIAKATGTSKDWACYHEYVDSTAPDDYYLKLNEPDPRAGDNEMWKSEPTSSVVNLGSYTFNNISGPMIMYAWHSVEGYSKFGGYTGSSGTDNTFIYLGFTPAFLMVKCTSHSGNWVIKDTSRSPNNPSVDNLYANDVGGNQSALDIDLLSNGFKIREERTDTGYDTRNYVYMAFASSPFGGENAPPATAR